MDIAKLKSLLEGNADVIPIIMITITNNTGGGQPVSMQNIKDVSNIARQFNKPFIIDSCRFAENAYFIKTREKGYADVSIEDIVHEIFSYADGMTMSAKKDAIAHIGGWLAVNDDELAEKIENLVILTEGFKTYGGLAGRDLEAIATGMISGIEFDYLDHRVGQVKKLGKLLQEAGVPIINPTGGHAVYVNAKEFLPHIPNDQFPAAALAVAAYIEGGIRGSEVGSLMFGKNATKELLRLAIPRRVYGSEHIEYVASIFTKIVKHKENIKGMKIIKEPQRLRHFSALLGYA
jgi:tyrosine phenol-lyase